MPTLSAATIYEWKDAIGETHYGQEPPANTNAVIVKPKFAPSTTQEPKIPSSTTEKKEQKIEAKKTENVKEPLDPKTLEAMKHNCEGAKTHLQDMESKPRIRLQDASGKVVFLTDEQRTQEIVKTKAAVEKFCNPK